MLVSGLMLSMFWLLCSRPVYSSVMPMENYEEEQIFGFIADAVRLYYKDNGWHTIITFGSYPKQFYEKLQSIGTILTNDAKDNHEFKEVIPYLANSVIMRCADFRDFENTLPKVLSLTNWHPHANVFLYYETKFERELIAHTFYILWYYKIINAIIIYYEDQTLQIAEYSPYISEFYKLQHNMGCFTVKKIGIAITNFIEDLKCQRTCENVTVTSKKRANNLGTCIGFDYHSVALNDRNKLLELNLFNDKSVDLHGFTLRAYGIEVMPFLGFEEIGNGSYRLHQRDGMIWNTMASKMNFSIDVSPSVDVIKKKFDFEVSIQQIFAFSHRKADLFLLPIYLIDLIIVQLDLTYPFKESGVCFISHRAGFETILFDSNVIEENISILVQMGLSFLGVWFTFSIYNAAEKGNISFDQIGKDFINSIRNVLTVSLHRPPKRQKFRIFLTITIWSYFVINFSTQAAIISFFSAYKRGKEVETFDDIVEKGYNVEGMASPDVMLPDDDERFNKINAKLVPIKNMFECITKMSNDSHRFCLIDCSVSRYLEKNRLNEKGEQYLHVATDRVHNHYLNFIFSKLSPMTNEFNRNMMALVESGIIKKLEDYRYTEIKEEPVVKSLSMEDLNAIFKCYWLITAFTSLTFILELTIGLIKKITKSFILKLKKWNHYQKIKKTEKKRRTEGNIKFTDVSTQTVVINIHEKLN